MTYYYALDILQISHGGHFTQPRGDKHVTDEKHGHYIINYAECVRVSPYECQVLVCLVLEYYV